MAFQKGQSGNPSGRPRGSKNRLTELKQTFPEVFERIGGVESFAEWATENRTAFYKLMGQILPKQHEVGGEDGEPIQAAIKVTFVRPQDR